MILENGSVSMNNYYLRRDPVIPLSIVDKTRGAIAIASCDLDVTVRNYSGRQIGKRYMQVRRSDTFDILRHEYRQETPQPLAEQ